MLNKAIFSAISMSFIFSNAENTESIKDGRSAL